jgi:hypothetical protein
LPPSAPNAVLLAIEGDSAEALDVAATLRGLRIHRALGHEGAGITVWRMVTAVAICAGTPEIRGHIRRSWYGVR